MLLLKSMKDVINILGGDKQKVQSEHKEFYDFVKTLPNSNWQVWAAKQYKNDPNGFKQYKDDLVHFSGSVHVKDIAEHRFDDKIHDTWGKGVNALKEKENQYVEKIKQNKFLIKPSSKVQEIVPINDEWGWFDLGVPYCTKEGEAMGHCGNQLSNVIGDKVLSLRRKIKVGNEEFHEPHLTFIENNGYLGEMKGRGNQKPSEKYHPHIVKLLQHPRIKGVVGGGYLHHNNFSLNDLNEQLRQEVLSKKPHIDVWKSRVEHHNIPPKFSSEKKTIKLLNKYKDKYGDKWKNKFLSDITSSSKYFIASTILNGFDYYGEDKDVLKYILKNASKISENIVYNTGLLANDKELKKLVWESDNKHAKLGLLEGLYANKEDISRALDDKKFDIRVAATKSPSFGAEHIDKALNDEDFVVRSYAVKSKHFGPQHMDKALNDENESVRFFAVQSPHFGPQHIDKALNDEDFNVRMAAIFSKHFEPKHAEMILGGKDKYFKKIVINRINKEPEKFKSVIEKYPHLFKKESIEMDLSKSMKDVVNILGGDKQKVQTEHKDFYDFVKKLPNANWQIWAAKQYKNDPEGFLKYKSDLEHFAGSTHIKDIADHRFDNKIHDSWEKGIGALKEKENKYIESLQNNQFLIKPSKKIQEIVPINDEWGWFDLGVPYCAKEGEAMGHCGNKPSHIKGDRVLSLRRKIKVKNKEFHEPHLTFIEHNGYLGEMKGRGNQKPSEKYHPHIAKLLQHDRIKGIIGGGYLHHSNFSLNDLDEKLRQEILSKKPNIDVWRSGIENHDIPKKFYKEKEAIKWLNTYKKKHGDNWKNQFLSDITDSPQNNIPSLVLNHFDYHGKDRDVLKHVLKNIEKIPNEIAIHASSLANDKELKDLVWKSGNNKAKLALLSGIYADKKDIDRALNSKDWTVRETAVKSPYFGPEHIDRALNDKSDMVREAAIKSPYFGPQHIEKVLNDKDPLIRLTAVQSPHFGLEHMDRALNDEDPLIRLAAIESPHFNSQHMERALNDKNPNIRLAAVQSKHFGPEHIEKALNDEDWEIRTAAVQSKHFGPQYIEKALNDENVFVRKAVLKSPHFKPQYMDRVLNDKDWEVRQAAVSSPHFGPQHIEKALSDKDWGVREAVVRSPYFRPEHMERVLNDNDWRVRLAAIKSKHFGPEHAEKALNDKNSSVRSAAINVIKNSPKRFKDIIVKHPDLFA